MAKKKTKEPKKTNKLPVTNMFYNSKIIFWGLFVLGFLLYANTIPHDYTQDDAIVIYDNEFTQKGIAGIPDILTHDTFRGFFKEEGKEKLVAGGRYRPFTLLMFAVEHQIAGSKPWLGHLINALLSGLTGGLIFLLIQLMLISYGKKEYATFIAISTAVLFISHPIHTEAVANIKGRDEIIAFLGSIAALYLTLRAYKETKRRLLPPALLLFFFALLSKENAITFVAIVPLVFFVFSEAKPKQILNYSLPFLAIALLFLFIRGAVIGWDFGDTPRELMNNPYLKLVNGNYVDFSTSERLATVFFSLGIYLKLLLLPHPLTHDYYPKHIDLMSWSDPLVILSLLLYIGIGLWSILAIVKKNHLAFAVLYFLITLSIVSNLVFPIGTHLSERFLFMPSLGFCMALSIIIYRIFSKRKTNTPQQTFFNAPFLIIATISLLFSAKTVDRNSAWKNNFTLFTTDVNTSKRSAKLRNAVGGELIAQAIKPENKLQKEKMIKDAIIHLNEAIQLHPTYKNAWLLLGNAHNYLEEYEKAISYYKDALDLDPNYEEAKNNLGITYRQAGRYYGEQKGDMQRSLQYLLQAYNARPNEYETLRLLGVAYGITGDQLKAIEFFTQAANLEPGTADAWWNLASAYYYNQQPDKAEEYQQKAIQIDPNIQNRK